MMVQDIFTLSLSIWNHITILLYIIDVVIGILY